MTVYFHLQAMMVYFHLLAMTVYFYLPAKADWTKSGDTYSMAG